jgi:hypothetical protein
MSLRKMNHLLPTGLLMLSGGLIMRNYVHGRYSDFAAGFLIGMSIVFMIAGILRQSRRPAN